MATYDNRNDLFTAVCTALGVTAKFEKSGTSTRPTGAGAKTLQGGYAHLLCNKANMPLVQGLLDNGNIAHKDISYAVLRAGGTSTRDSSKSATVARLDATAIATHLEFAAKAKATLERLSKTKSAAIVVHTHKAELKDVTKSVNASFIALLETNQVRLEAKREAQKAAKASKKGNTPPVIPAENQDAGEV